MDPLNSPAVSRRLQLLVFACLLAGAGWSAAAAPPASGSVAAGGGEVARTGMKKEGASETAADRGKEAVENKPASVVQTLVRTVLAEKVLKVTLQVIPSQVKFDMTRFDVHAGQSVALSFKNGCVMPHNVLFLDLDAEPAVVGAVNTLGAEGFAKGFVPEVPGILAASKLLAPGTSEVLKFTAPQKPGDYTYLCTFPGHWFTMRGVMRVRPEEEKLENAERVKFKADAVADALRDSGVTHTPMGTMAKPLVMRTFAPDPGLDDAVFAHHGRGQNAVKYDPATRRDVTKKEKDAQTGLEREEPVVVAAEKGVAGAIAVSHGEEFAYVWDSTECRLLYAWRGGFLDMNTYWGKEPGGMRPKYYIPKLVGALVYRATVSAPLSGGAQEAPRFGGYKMVKGAPEFFYTVDGRTVRERVVPGAAGAFSLEVEVEGGSVEWKVAAQEREAVSVKTAQQGAVTRVRVAIQDRKAKPLEVPAKKSGAGANAQAKE